MTIPQGKDICSFFFDRVDGTNYKCQICENDYKVSGTGSTNLKTHVINQHRAAYDEFSQGGADKSIFDLDKYVYNAKTKKIHAWIEYITMTLSPFHHVENCYVRKIFKHEPMSLNTFHKYMEKLTVHVEKKITDDMPENFSVILDGWTANDTHYMGLFASFPRSDDVGYKRVLLSFSLFINEEFLDADEHVNFIELHLGIYDKNVSNVICVTGDNFNTNKALSDKLGCHLVGCASHRFNLAVKDILLNYENIIEQIHSLIKKARSLKLSAKLRVHTNLRPKIRNDSRWSSTYDVLKRFLQLNDVLPKLESEEVDDLLLTPQQTRKVENLCDLLEKLDSVTKVLQSDKTTMAEVRVLFDSIVEDFPETTDRLSVNAGIVHDVAFESVVSKIMDNRVGALTSMEKDATKELKRDKALTAVATSTDNISFAQRLLKKRRLSQTDGDTSYIDLLFILPTSNICEILFSITGYALSDRRKGISPARFESQIFLHLNCEFWGIK